VYIYSEKCIVVSLTTGDLNMYDIEKLANQPVRSNAVALLVNKDVRVGFEKMAARLGFVFTVTSPKMTKMRDIDGRRAEVEYA
jgi:hypothetical protein